MLRFTDITSTPTRDDPTRREVTCQTLPTATGRASVENSGSAG